MSRQLLLILTLLSFLSSCYRVSPQIEPRLRAPPHPKEIEREKRICLNLPQDFSKSPFPSLSVEEKQQDWGKEYSIALEFAEDFDLYRAITGFKRALHFLPSDQTERRQEIEYEIALAYYLGRKYLEVVHAVQSTDLLCVDDSFPAFPDLLLILYDSYSQLGNKEQACHLLGLIESDKARKLTLLSALERGDLPVLSSQGHEKLVNCYCNEAKSIRKAEVYNALLPGAGYWYVGLKETAVTALLVNSVFIAAAAHFIDRGNVGAAIFTLSIESGWYFGGIYGAGLAAKRYNERLYERYADNITKAEELFPVMMLRYTF